MTTKKPTAKPQKSDASTTYYNPQTGKLTGREIKAQKRLDELTAQYQASGLSEADARERARKELRDNARKDWRA